MKTIGVLKICRRESGKTIGQLITTEWDDPPSGGYHFRKTTGKPEENHRNMVIVMQKPWENFTISTNGLLCRWKKTQKTWGKHGKNIRI